MEDQQREIALAVIFTKLKMLIAPVMAIVLAGEASYALAQTSRTNTQTAAQVAATEQRPAAPQVVTVVHRLTGIKVLRLLLHSGAVGALDTMDESFSMTSEVHTNILAGLALDDGETIAVWLPEAELEVDAWQSFTPSTPPLLPRPLTPPRVETAEGMELSADLTVTPDLTIIGRDGRNRSAQYLGLDGVTGLSLLKISGKTVSGAAGKREAAIAIKQRVRLFAPEPAPEGRASTSSTVSVRIGETGGTIVSLRRGLAGEINRVRMLSAKLSTANVGGIAINDAGQTIGIVTGIEGNEAVILPPAVIRAAAQRVLARKGSVPRPWLGVSGESLASTPFESIVQLGWEPARAALLKNQRGLFLTSIAPGSPAETAALRAGDVITRVNNSEVKSADDFSLLLADAGENALRFTIVRPNHPEPESVSVKLSEVFDSWPRLDSRPGIGPRGLVISPLITQGIETMPLRATAAARLNAASGLFVIYVQPQTAAAKAGLRPTDVIEAINGQPVLSTGPQQVQTLTRFSYTLSIVRDREKMVLTVETPAP